MHFQFRKVASAEGPTKFHESLDVSDLIKGRKDVSSIAPLVSDLQLYAAGEDMVDVTGTLKTELHVACSRCLTPVARVIDIDFKERFIHGQEPEQEQDLDDNAIYVEDESVDLVPYLEESLMLNLPFAVVCKDDCKGLCPACGTNLNEHDCGCDTTAVDPRLAALKDFFK
ncbi:metal-binding protein [Paenibacillus yonginensis]|uniref:Metal-binding protein n=1 Tax=Paenibacillus yonginensis TaxID=1462996 RepID=A0A1B1MXP7_9BACL|nr:DUF177 domain-containing protein [Paenibacillus yonginensis]ANS73945.1 metal-binding protein [Paenibacillus yonginensis]